MGKAYKTLFWGVIILNVSLTIGPFRILPTFVGWWIVYHGFQTFEEQVDYKHSSILKKCLLLLIAVTAIEDLISFAQGMPQGAILAATYYPVIIKGLELVVFHKIFEMTVMYFNQTKRPSKVEEYIEKDKRYIQLMGAALLPMFVAVTFSNTATLVLGVGLGLISSIYLLMSLYPLSKETYSEA